MITPKKKWENSVKTANLERNVKICKELYTYFEMYKKLNFYKKKYYLYKSILICNVVYNGVHVKLANYRYIVKEHM